MADTTIGNWFDKVFFDAHGEPCAGGSLFFYQTGTDIPLGVTTAGGVLLGACVRLDDDGRPVDDFRFYADRKYRVVLKDSHGAVVKQFDDVCILPGEGGGMYNPMTAAGDLIKGGTDGEPSRLAAGNEGDVLKVVSGVPTWTAPVESGKVRIAQNTPLKYAGDAILPGTGLKGVGDLINGTKTISVDADGVPAGHVLTADGDDGCNWAPPTVGMTNPMTEQGDLIAGAADGEPMRIAHPGDVGFLRAAVVSGIGKVLQWVGLNAGQHITIAQDGAGATISADEQEGDHKLLVSATDAAAGYLGAKLTAGANITITPQTDGDGVQTLELSATGGGGGGSRMLFTPGFPNGYYNGTHGSDYIQYQMVPMFCQYDKLGSIALIPFRYSGDTKHIPTEMDLAVYEGAEKSTATKLTSFTYSAPASWADGIPLWFDFDAVVDIDLTKNHWLAVTSKSWGGSYRMNWVRCVNYSTNSTLADSNAAEMCRPVWTANGPATLPDALSQCPAGSYENYGMNLWFCASTTKMNS